MIVLNTSIRVLKPLSRKTHLLRLRNKTILRSLASFAKTSSNVCQVPGSEQRRYYAECAPNIIRSPYPDVVLPEVLLTDFLWTKAEKWSDLTALVCGLTGREIKYKQLRLLSRRLATSLLKEGFKPGEVIAMILPNMPEFPVVALGILEAGLIVTTINPLYTADEIVYQVTNSQASAIITIPEKLDTVLKAKSVIEGKSKSGSSKLRIICTNDVLGNEVKLPTAVDKFSHLIGDNVDDTELPSLQTQKRSTNDIAVIPYSSGTTGIPKGVCLTHRNLIACIVSMVTLGNIEEATRSRTHANFIFWAVGPHHSIRKVLTSLYPYIKKVKTSILNVIKCQEVVPAILPAFHIYGLSVVLFQSLHCGAKIITLPKFEEKSFFKVLKKYECTILYFVPPLVLFLGASPNVTKEHLKSVKIIQTGAAPIADSDIMKCVKKSPPTLIYKQGYGLTETSPSICGMQKDLKKYNSVGAVAVNTLVKIADLQTNQALGPNEEGEICVKGPQVMKGYLNNEKATTEVFDNEGWFRTGDIGYYDNDMHMYITDRLKELIKVKGFQVAPAELEAILRSHPDVEDAGVIGVPDPRKGESPVGFVKLKKYAKVTKEDLKAFIAPKVATFKQIDTIVFVDSIPKSVSGKILRKDIRANYLKQMDLKNVLETKKPLDRTLNYANERN